MGRQILGIDVGGSSVKAGRVDIDAGRLLGGLGSVATPSPSTPQALTAVFQELAATTVPGKDAVGIALPSVIKRGVALTAANIDAGWVGTDARALAERALGRPVVFLNDADAAGLAEVRWGAGRGFAGTIIMLTFGTGIGSALFNEGRLWPNSEFGHMELKGVDAELRASARVRTAEKLDFPAWAERVNEYLAAMDKLFWPDMYILGGAISERFDEFSPLLRSQAALKPAQFGNHAGVIGAALAAGDAHP